MRQRMKNVKESAPKQAVLMLLGDSQHALLAKNINTKLGGADVSHNYTRLVNSHFRTKLKQKKTRAKTPQKNLKKNT